MPGLHIFLINLDRSPERLAHIRVQADAAGITFERVPGVDGATMTQPFLGNTFANYLSPGERGCYASHLLCCHKILEQNLPHALILEDDAVLGHSAVRIATDAATRVPKGWDFIQASGLPRHATVPVAALGHANALVQYSRRPPFNATGYLMSAAGAEKFLSPRHRIVPNDNDVRRQAVFKFNVYGIEPRIIAPETAFVSEAGHNDTVSRRYRAIERAGRVQDWLWRVQQIGPLGMMKCSIDNALHRFVVRGARQRLRDAGPDSGKVE